ncbi:transposase IS66 family protein [Trichonephila inaurata madagascariensis]|uniref:Transposase IS66 family protein n=1 Tax=Trichonephila inaurata madagascariensis TaxID=2747483 RepID=A0A8X6Y442_9ARAC|nr:transposase IS66 family protein [Trichonephila inaurata madagascariensis]
MDADEVIKVELSSTCECRGKIAICKKPYIHQKVDLPEIKPYVVEYQLEHGRCRKCGKEEAANYQKVLHQIHLDQGLSQ